MRLAVRCADLRMPSFYSMNKAIQDILRVVKNDPAVQNAISFTGGGGASNTANMFCGTQAASRTG